MPTFATAFYTATKEARLATGRLGASNISSGTVEYAVIPYVLAGTEAAADVINLCLLPAGVIPVPELSKMVCMSDPGTAFTVKIGTAADDDGWAVSLAATVAGAVETLISGGTAPAWMVTPTPLVADTGSGNAIVKATVSTATAITATTVIHFILAYKRGR
jgi:hypothetical protein